LQKLKAFSGCSPFFAHHHEPHVVDPVSVAVSKRKRRAKIDKIDGEAVTMYPKPERSSHPVEAAGLPAN
jgi:hypothetical protein